MMPPPLHLSDIRRTVNVFLTSIAMASKMAQ